MRFVLEGEGIFDIRSRDDRWMRVVVEQGDLIVVPKDRHHRFMLTETKTIRCVRLFRTRAAGFHTTGLTERSLSCIGWHDSRASSRSPMLCQGS